MSRAFVVFLVFSTLAVCQQKKKAVQPNQTVIQAKCPWGGECERIAPIVIPGGRILVTVGGEVHMLSSDGRELWKHSTGAPLFAPVYNSVLDEVAIVGLDLYFVRLDASTGRLKWQADTVGRAGFEMIVPFQKGYLVVVNMAGYRENDKVMNQRLTPDHLEYWGPHETDFWSVPFPQRADVLVSGDKVFAVISRKDKITVREIAIPTGKNR